MHVAVRPVLPLLLVASLAAAGCGGGGDDPGDADAKAIRELPDVKQNGRVSAVDVAAANELCRKYQKKKPKLVTQLRIKIKGSPSVTCIVQ
jgi:hypothetical protein